MCSSDKEIETLLKSLNKTKFRGSFHLNVKMLGYVKDKGIDKIKSDAYDLITKRKANYDDYEYEIIPNISYEYDEDQDTSGEYWNENCYLSVTVKDERKAKMSFDVVNSKTLNLYCIDYLK